MPEKDFDELLKHLNEKELNRYAKTHLSEEKQQRLKEILSDKRKLNEIMNSRKAQEILKKLKGQQNG